MLWFYSSQKFYAFYVEPFVSRRQICFHGVSWYISVSLHALIFWKKKFSKVLETVFTKIKIIFANVRKKFKFSIPSERGIKQNGTE